MKRLDDLTRRATNEAFKALDITEAVVTFVMTESELSLTDDQISERYFQPAIRELVRIAKSLDTEATHVSVDVEPNVSTPFGKSGVQFTFRAQTQCPWDREPTGL